MANLSVEEIIRATGGRLLSQNSGVFRGVSIDSRTISAGEIFFALKGPRFDGHDFLAEAISTGAGGIVVEREIQFPVPNSRFPVIIVRDTLKALQDLAYFLRKKQNIPVVAITGSNGKTTTKEMVFAVLSRRFKVLKNEGNLNNQIGLPLSLTRISPEHEAAVLELGMNSSGEIRRLCEIAVPSHGVITNIGSAHIGELGSLDSIRKAKLEILEGLGTVVLNADDNFLMEGVKGFKGKIITFSTNPGRKKFPKGANSDSDVKAEDLLMSNRGSSFILKLKGGKDTAVTLNIHGLFNVYNALAASAVCHCLGIDIEDIKAALESYRAVPMRFEVLKRDDITLINDSYNANPSSMGEAIKEMVRMGNGKRKVAVLGDMMELGESSETEHRDVGKMIAGLGIDVFVAVGGMMSLAAEEAQMGRSAIGGRLPEIYTYNTADEAWQGLNRIIMQGDVVLVKGSRAMRMEKITSQISPAKKK